MTILDALSRIYRKTGIHAAPPGTILHGFNAKVHSIIHRRARTFASIDTISRGTFGGIPYYNLSRLRQSRRVGLPKPRRNRPKTDDEPAFGGWVYATA